MPRIRFIRLRCGCGSEYKVGVERIAEGTPLECCSCGAAIEVACYTEELELLHRYSELVLKIEERFEVDGDTVEPARQGTRPAGAGQRKYAGLG